MAFPDLHIPACPNCQADQMHHLCVSHDPGSVSFQKMAGIARRVALAHFS